MLALRDRASTRPGAQAEQPAPAASDRAHFAALMRRVAETQDRDAFAALFAYYAPRVKSYLLRIGAGEALAEELTQEAMLVVWRKAALFDPAQASVSTWIFRIARNRRIDAARRDGKPALSAEEPMLAPAQTEAPDERLSALEREDAVRAALADLPPEQIALLQAAFYEGLSHSEIAAREGLPLGTVKSRIRLAFGRLRAKLDGAV
ncbi:MAG: sigma-70 family RNA polymerase sigma factor [Hyphomonadaceae bacterium]|nr:sigma-70 family RNA polymerase sigma factor [Hyphomonadaceae bacterium]